MIFCKLKMLIPHELIMLTTSFLLLKICASNVISNSTCGPNYPYRKCYNEYKLLRIFTPNENKITTVKGNVLNKLDLDIWSYPNTEINGTDLYFDVLVSPNVEEVLQNLLQSKKIDSTILHPNINDFIQEEIELVCKNVSYCLDYILKTTYRNDKIRFNNRKTYFFHF